MGIKNFLKEHLSEEQLELLRRIKKDVDYTLHKNLPEECMLKRMFKERMGYPLNLDNPQTFNEKLQWLKLHDRNPLYTTMVDKYEVKKYVAGKIGEQYIIPTLGVWDHFDEIDFDKLPDKFVLKCTHDSGSVVLCRDKVTFDKAAAKRKLERGLARDYYYVGYEWPYKDVKPRIIAEKFMIDESGDDPMDYKIHNFNGIPEIILVCKERFTEAGLSEDFFDTNWVHLDIKRPHNRNANIPIACPEKLEKMIELSTILSENTAFSRVDFYEINKKLYFGEITFFPANGMEKFIPDKWDKILGDKIHLQQLSAGGGHLLISDDGFALWIHITDDREDKDIVDYKLLCFHGKVYCTFTCTDRRSSEGLKVTFFDNNWNKLPFERHYPSSDKNIGEPKNFQQMKMLAEKLSESIPFVRVDFYEISGNIYFGELTFYPGSGMEEFNPVEWDKILGDKIHIEQLSAGGGHLLINDDGFVLRIHQENLDTNNENLISYLTDYKIFCFDGKPTYIMTVNGGHDVDSKISRRLYDIDWKLLPVGIGGTPIEITIEEFNFSPAKAKWIMVVSIIFGALAYVLLNTVTAAVIPTGYSSWYEYIDDVPNLNGLFLYQHSMQHMSYWEMQGCFS